MDFLPEVISFILGFGSGLTLKIVWDKSRKDSNIVKQKNINTGGGDNAGRDIIK